MAETIIQEAHKPALTRQQHVLEWLSAERARLIAELNHVVEAGQREQAKLAAFLQSAYGVAAEGGFTLDAERGVIVTSDPAPEQPEPTPENVTPFLGREPGA